MDVEGAASSSSILQTENRIFFNSRLEPAIHFTARAEPSKVRKQRQESGLEVPMQPERAQAPQFGVCCPKGGCEGLSGPAPPVPRRQWGLSRLPPAPPPALGAKPRRWLLTGRRSRDARPLPSPAPRRRLPPTKMAAAAQRSRGGSARAARAQLAPEERGGGTYHRRRGGTAEAGTTNSEGGTGKAGTTAGEEERGEEGVQLRQPDQHPQPSP